MLVLLTNDDGIGARGLHELRLALAELDDVDVRVIAPNSNRSGTARSITTRSPIWVEEVEFDDGTIGFAADGTPVDCVRFGDLGLLGGRPDLIVSGINHGSNLGDDITYSGTVAAAFEGIVLGIPAVAVSQQAGVGGMGYAGREYDFSYSAPITREVVRRVIDEPLSPSTLININCPAGDPRGDRDRPARQASLQRRAAPGRGGGRQPAALRDLRLRAVPRGRGRNRSQRGRRRAGRDHADPLRPHRPRRGRAARGLGPGGPRRRAGDRPPMSAGPQESERVAELRRLIADADQPLLRARRPDPRRRRVRRPDARAPGARGGGPGADHPGLAHPARERPRNRPLPPGPARRADAVARQRPRGG